MDEELSFPNRFSARAWTRSLMLLVLAVAGIGCSAARDSKVQVQPDPDWLEFREVARQQSAAFPLEVNHRVERGDGEESISTYYASETPFLTALDVRVDQVAIEDDPVVFERADEEVFAVTYEILPTPFLSRVEFQVDVETLEHEPDSPGRRIVVPLQESGRGNMRQFTTENDHAEFGVFVRNELIKIVIVNSVVDADIIYLRSLPEEKVELYYSRITGAE